MAASIYATPPPDLSGEDTALSDVSNSSQLSNTSSQSKKGTTKRSIAEVLLSSSNPSSATSSLASVVDALQLDQLKKRRKQSTPIRISALNLSANAGQTPAGGVATEDGGEAVQQVEVEQEEQEEQEEEDDVGVENETPNEDFEEKLSKIFLPKTMMGQNPNANSNAMAALANPFNISATSPTRYDLQEQYRRHYSDMKQCKECGEMFDSDLKLSVHILQEHTTSAGGNDGDERDTKRGLISIIPHERMKMEKMDSHQQPPQATAADMMHKSDWMTSIPSIASLGFPFSAEALSANGYLSQLPMLGGVPPYPAMDGLSRPPLRIFNPEAYCDLCNKEFCNKYFLKTHKANKHGIYDPVVTSSGDTNVVSSANLMSQAYQMQYQPDPYHQQSQHQPPSPPKPPVDLDQQQSPLIPTGGATIYCDVCNKRFTNIFAMKRHRSKAHEIPPPPPPAPPSMTTAPLDVKTELDNSSSPRIVAAATLSMGMGGNNNSNEPTPDNGEKEIMPFRLPEGFREDYTLEQEDVSFAPQPRKLSSSSQLLAREANFAFDKLKRLGIINPDAFCNICCKEYCNKYFLRTHKWKRHGIYVPVEDAAKEQPSAAPQWAPFMGAAAAVASGAMQTTPLNLMMAGEKLQHVQQFYNGGEPKRMKMEEAEKQPEEALANRSSAQQDSAELAGLNLQKLQSMIMQLNDLNGKRPVACPICGQELANQYVLQVHIASEHGASDNNNGSFASPKTTPIGSPTTTTDGIQNGGELCKQCEREFATPYDLKQHILEMHSAEKVNSSPLRDGFITPDRPVKPNSAGPLTPMQQSGVRPPPFSMTPTSSYCEICNKELCNKYFMKTHMQRMHGIEIENGAQIGGVVCNICNKELCSKYFLRVHKHNTHGIVDESAPLPPGAQQRAANGDPTGGGVMDQESLYPLEPKIEINDGSSRYFTHYTEVCPICTRRFRSSKWLRAHLMSDHGQAGVDKLRELELQMGTFGKSHSPTLKIPNGGSSNPSMMPKNPFARIFKNENPSVHQQQQQQQQQPRFKEYQCSLCPFTTPYIPFLFIHERSHSILNYGASPGNASPPLQEATTVAPPPHTADNHEEDAKDLSALTIAAVSSLPPSPPAARTPTSSPLSGPVDTKPQLNNASGVATVDPTLADIANQTNRPASYAFPKSFSGQEHMQTFYVEEATAAPSGDSEASKRFVPAVIYLPVRERISGPITVSFTLTPA